ncbi:MAG TPA: GNAT family N-acetyltransferase [Nocardioides sp.]|uniref:GNAT family N-acetyltransferase n=1 Tax=Nocardioides sp. TaxID=35761 RepID=UPI002CE27FF5|nr:GNAT family N-acetyltransferase [Nocardioides sp.]HQR26286.1 GNAT family N-acetyltransferase [Nocardioides sp.]
MRIRRALPTELAAVGDLTVAAYAPFVDGPEDPYTHHLRDAARRDREAELWVATDEDGRLLGTVTTCPVGSPWREIAADDEGEFRMLAVAPDAQGQGVGDALVAHSVAVSRRRRHRAVVLSSLRTMAAAHRVYQRQGFRRTPERDWAPLPGVDLITFARDLEE